MKYKFFRYLKQTFSPWVHKKNIFVALLGSGIFLALFTSFNFVEAKLLPLSPWKSGDLQSFVNPSLSSLESDSPSLGEKIDEPAEEADDEEISLEVNDEEESLIEENFDDSTSEINEDDESDQPSEVDTRQRVTVVRVIDGDTFTARDGSILFTVRLIGVNAPESVDPKTPVQCWGPEASQHLKQYLSGKTVVLQADSAVGNKDAYGRILRYVLLNDETNVNKWLINQGDAREYTFKTPYSLQKEFKQAQLEAKQKKLGLWGACKKK